MLNRHTFLKTNAASIGGTHPDAQSCDDLKGNNRRRSDQRRGSETYSSAVQAGSGRSIQPALAAEHWARRSEHVTEHYPAVMNIKERADYWHSAGADIVFHQRDRRPRPLFPPRSRSTPRKVSQWP